MPEGIDPASLAIGAVNAGLGVVQTISGLIGKGKARRKIDKLLAQRKAYQTPEETYKALEATKQNAQTGFGAETLKYLTGSADRAFSSSVGAATLLGGDPNDLGAIFEQRMNESMKISGQDTALRMANFSKFLTALNTVAENKAAEQISRDNLIKDRIQAASAQGADATKNLQGGLNSILAGGSMMAASGLFGDSGGVDNSLTPYTDAGVPIARATAGNPALQGVTGAPRVTGFR